MSVFVVLVVSICIILAVVIVSYFTSNCAVADCKVEIDRMSYGEAVDILEDIVKNKPENKDKFIKNFFDQIRSTCVA